jgi:hypothetical protein
MFHVLALSPRKNLDAKNKRKIETYCVRRREAKKMKA